MTCEAQLGVMAGCPAPPVFQLIVEDTSPVGDATSPGVISLADGAAGQWLLEAPERSTFRQVLPELGGADVTVPLGGIKP